MVIFFIASTLHLQLLECLRAAHDRLPLSCLLKGHESWAPVALCRLPDELRARHLLDRTTEDRQLEAREALGEPRPSTGGILVLLIDGVRLDLVHVDEVRVGVDDTCEREGDDAGLEGKENTVLCGRHVYAKYESV